MKVKRSDDEILVQDSPIRNTKSHKTRTPLPCEFYMCVENRSEREEDARMREVKEGTMRKVKGWSKRAEGSAGCSLPDKSFPLSLGPLLSFSRLSLFFSCSKVNDGICSSFFSLIGRFASSRRPFLSISYRSFLVYAALYILFCACFSRSLSAKIVTVSLSPIVAICDPSFG